MVFPDLVMQRLTSGHDFLLRRRGLCRILLHYQCHFRPADKAGIGKDVIDKIAAVHPVLRDFRRPPIHGIGRITCIRCHTNKESNENTKSNQQLCLNR